jgi:hypothetical protein
LPAEIVSIRKIEVTMIVQPTKRPMPVISAACVAGRSRMNRGSVVGFQK